MMHNTQSLKPVRAARLAAGLLAAALWTFAGDAVAQTTTASISAPQSVMEGDDGSTSVTFIIRLSRPAFPRANVNFGIDVAAGTATLGADYKPLATGGDGPQTVLLRFNRNEQVKQITLQVYGDTTDEPDQTLVVRLSGAVFVQVDPDPVTVTIVDDDPPPSLSIGDAGMTAEGDGAEEEDGQLTFPVSLSAASEKQITVAYADAGTGTATAGTDYTALEPGMLTFAAGETAASIAVQVIGDTVSEPDETVVVALSDPVNVTLETATGTGTITDEDPLPAFAQGAVPDQVWQVGTAIADLVLPAGAGGHGELTYTLEPDLPQGLAFDPATRTVSGTPTAAMAETEYTLTATDADGDATTLTFTILVKEAEPEPVIDDTEPRRQLAMRKVLAGMGRWVAADAVEAIRDRFAGRQAGEAQLGLGGRTIPLPGIGELARGLDPGHPGLAGAGTPERETSRPALTAESLSRSRFNLPLDQQNGAGGLPGWRIWGQGSAGGFEGRPEAGFRMDGKVVGGYVGFDYLTNGGPLLGVAVGRSRGDIDYETDEAGTVDLELTSVLPYAHWSPRAGLGVWYMLGAGWGDIVLEDEDGRAEADLNMRMAAAGLRQDVATWRRIEVAVEADALLARMETDAARASQLPRAAGKTQRLRLRLEGRTQRALSPGQQLIPSLEIGGRWDGGDAETGLGAEVGAGLLYAHRALGLEVEAQGRFLLAHRDPLEEWGANLAARLDPGQVWQGPWMMLAPGWGAEGSRMERMWDGEDAFHAHGASAAEALELSPDRLHLELGWGLPDGAALWTPWAGLSMAGSRVSDYRLGARMEAENRMSLSLENRHSKAAGYEVMLYGRLEW